ncbi:MAG: heat-inducible transcriptional repressor [Gammaproteobacteria bacterium]|jgi:heat-inducible transcriptional repressor|tara:strand:+ start:135 stop:1202 length:1068 start_codon:yes stop_codon:yes gene_type:complete
MAGTTTDNQGMELNERAGLILRALVQSYIHDGQPVGSRKLSKSTGLSLSPASIRNVMSDLEELGFIAAPHTSAGRIPTPRGYRFFVDTLLKLQEAQGSDISDLQKQILVDDTGDARELASSVSSLLSSMTEMAGLVTLPRVSHVVLRQVEFLPISNHRVLAILVVNDHEVQNRILHLDREYSESELKRAANYLNTTYAGKELNKVRDLVIEEMRLTQRSMNQLMIDTISIAQQALTIDTPAQEYVMAGEAQLMNFHELSDIDKLKQLFEAFNQKREMLGLLDQSIVADGVKIFIGEESGYQLLGDCSIVTAPYRVDDEIVGVLGVIGPTRMAYERVIPIVDVTAKLVGAALKSAQ